MLRVNRKIFTVIILIISIFLIYISYGRVQFSRLKSGSAEVMEQAYLINDTLEGNQVIMRINNTDVSYYWFKKEQQKIKAYFVGEEDLYSDQEVELNAFDAIYLNIVLADEAKHFFESNEGVPAFSEEDVIHHYRVIFTDLSKNSDSPQVAGVSSVLLKNIKRDLEIYEREFLFYLWQNRHQPGGGLLPVDGLKDEGINPEPVIDDPLQLKKETKAFVSSALENAVIEYLDQNYSHLTPPSIEDLF